MFSKLNFLMFESNMSFNHLGIQLNTSPQRKSILFISALFPHISPPFIYLVTVTGVSAILILTTILYLFWQVKVRVFTPKEKVWWHWEHCFAYLTSVYQNFNNLIFHAPFCFWNVLSPLEKGDLEILISKTFWMRDKLYKL